MDRRSTTMLILRPPGSRLLRPLPALLVTAPDGSGGGSRKAAVFVLALAFAAGALALPSVSGAGGGAAIGGRAPPPVDAGYAGGPVVVPLYAHIYDLLQVVPMNTQPMIDKDLARGFGNPTVTGAGPLDTPNSLRLFGSPGLVEYNITEKNGLPRYHPERGISYDILLDPSKSIVGHWFMGVKAADAPQAGRTDGPEAGVMPGLTVRMTMRTGDEAGTNLDAGAIIAQGQATLDGAKMVDNGAPSEFVVDMGKPKMDRIPGNTSFNFKVEWFNAESPDGKTQLTQRDWILHTGSKFPDRVEISVLDPLAMYSVRPTPVGNDLLTIHATLNSPFGNYDVNTSTVELKVEGPTSPSSQNLAPPAVLQRSFEHNHHYEPVEVTWAWKYKDDSAKPGAYKVTVRAKNLQGTATVEKSASFVIPDAANGRAIGYDDAGGVVQAQGAAAPQKTPGAPVVVVLACAIALAVASRGWRGRRRGP